MLFDLFSGRDNKEGISSFLEKRKPDFQGSVNNPDDVPAAYPWWSQLVLRKWRGPCGGNPLYDDVMASRALPNKMKGESQSSLITCLFIYANP